MKLLNLTGINHLNDEADYLVSLKLSQEEKERIAEKDVRWKNAIDSTIAHVWVSNGSIEGIDLSVFDGTGDWEDGIPADLVLSQEAAENICKFVRDSLRQAEFLMQSGQTADTAIAAFDTQKITENEFDMER